MKVKLHSNDESAANATDATLKMLDSTTRIKRGPDGRVEFDSEGFATVVTSNPRYIAFALKNQGYVREIVV